MADYTFIADNELDPGSPLNTALFARLARNPEAIAEGQPGAPRVLMEAIGEDLVAGNVVRYSDTKVHSTGESWARPLDTATIQPGTLRLTFQHRGNPYGDSKAEVWSGGVRRAAYTATSTSWVSRTIDLTLSVGSQFTILHRSTRFDTVSEVRNIQLKTAGQWLVPMPTTAPKYIWD
ncbi:MAG: hypothetical protein AAGK03_03615 [Pseudomonadota bacterium]